MRAVNEAVASLIYWMLRLWVMLPETTAVVLVISARSPRVMTKNWGHISVRQVNVLERRRHLEGRRFKIAGKGFFSWTCAIIFVCNLYIGHYRTNRSRIMCSLSRVCK